VFHEIQDCPVGEAQLIGEAFCEGAAMTISQEETQGRAWHAWAKRQMDRLGMSCDDGGDSDMDMRLTLGLLLRRLGA
jgi:hypothetical protein